MEFEVSSAYFWVSPLYWG